MLHIGRWPELEQLELDSLHFGGLTVGALSLEQCCGQAHPIVELLNQIYSITHIFEILDSLLPFVSFLLLFPFPLLDLAGLSVVLRDHQESVSALREHNIVLKEHQNGILGDILSTSAKYSSLLWYFLAKPDRLANAVLPVIGGKHDSLDLLLGLLLI